jgi:hypothetical protein
MLLIGSYESNAERQKNAAEESAGVARSFRRAALLFGGIAVAALVLELALTGGASAGMITAALAAHYGETALAVSGTSVALSLGRCSYTATAK